ncbi:acetolactate synthase small subunit [Oceanicola granulosus HTCC2516]|uniref:Acetolactate synthase small subunit n=1 Tax=Oceanicola granulosus (strain ATCC BAA-861 / DSM 15982 / KCTC 12143 / HTCC2516) TaxID=314256 RepID=Q2CF96_OCEGH|nr:hypothetical protein [Oceanicola granulosus]EAR51399.1 acetolactate synthase small subunit [Oceanicola granulosus HTCC2516]
MTRIHTALATLLLVVPGLATAQEIQPNEEPMTLEQLLETYPDLSAIEFAELDTDGDGYLDADERAAMNELDIADDD